MPSEKSIASADRIVDAALHLFCRRGYAAVGTQDICEKADVLKGTLYHYFPSKIDIAIASLRSYGATMAVRYREIASAKASSSTRLRRLFRLAQTEAESALMSHGAVTGCLHGNLAMELSATEPRIRIVLQTIGDDWAKALSPITNGSPTAAAVLLTFLHGSVLAAKMANDPSILATMANHAIRLLPTGNAVTSRSG
jgi:TetR/AcrR family transcriptional repressor of nem operon